MRWQRGAVSVVAVSALALAGAPAATAATAATATPTSTGGPATAAADQPEALAAPSTSAAVPADVMAASAAPGSSWEPGPQKYGVGTTKDQPVTMADGTVLRADVYYPTDLETGEAAAGPFPVLMTQTPYGKSPVGSSGFAKSTGNDPYLISRGYIDVVADVRGTGNSGGQFGLFDPVQTTDGVTLVDWAARLPHSDGKVGLYGASYLAVNQIRTAGAVGKDSPLKAIFPVVAGTDIYRDTAFMGGILDAEFGLAYLGLTSSLNLLNPVLNGLTDPASLANLLDVESDHVTDEFTFDADFVLTTLTGGDTAYNDDYWQARQPSDSLPEVVANGIPAYLVGGEYDLFQRGEPLNYAALQNLWAGRDAGAPMEPGQDVTGRYQLWDGPFGHLAASAADVSALELRWFDTWLKGIDTGMADTPTPLHYFDLGTEDYVETDTFPFTGLTPTTYYLGPGRSGTAALSTNDGTLTTTPPTESGSDTIVWSPVGNPCGEAVDQWGAGPVQLLQQSGLPDLLCFQDDRPAQVGPAELAYTTEPMTTATMLGGPLSATVYATSTTTDTQWVAEITDVSPDGRSRPLTEGALLGSLRAVDEDKSWTAPDGQPLLPYHPYTRASAEPVTPGEVTRYDIEVFPTLTTIAPGHRIRVTFTTADTPHLIPTLPEIANLLGGVYQVQRTAASPSSIELPLGTIDDGTATADRTTSGTDGGAQTDTTTTATTASTAAVVTAASSVSTPSSAVRSLAATGSGALLPLSAATLLLGGLLVGRRRRMRPRP